MDRYLVISLVLVFLRIARADENVKYAAEKQESALALEFGLLRSIPNDNDTLNPDIERKDVAVGYVKRISGRLFFDVRAVLAIGDGTGTATVGVRLGLSRGTHATKPAIDPLSLFRFFDPSELYIVTSAGAASLKDMTGPSGEFRLVWLPLRGVDYGLGSQVSVNVSYIDGAVYGLLNFSVVVQVGQ